MEAMETEKEENIIQKESKKGGGRNKPREKIGKNRKGNNKI